MFIACKGQLPLPQVNNNCSYRCLSWSATGGSSQMSSNDAWGFRWKNFRNSFRDPRFHALDCCMPRTVIALRHFGILFGPKAPASTQHQPRRTGHHRNIGAIYQQYLQLSLSGSLPDRHLETSRFQRLFQDSQTDVIVDLWAVNCMIQKSVSLYKPSSGLRKHVFGETIPSKREKIQYENTTYCSHFPRPWRSS